MKNHDELRLKKSVIGLKSTEKSKPSRNEEEYFKKLDAERIRDIKKQKKQ